MPKSNKRAAPTTTTRTKRLRAEVHPLHTIRVDPTGAAALWPRPPGHHPCPRPRPRLRRATHGGSGGGGGCLAAQKAASEICGGDASARCEPAEPKRGGCSWAVADGGRAEGAGCAEVRHAPQAPCCIRFSTMCTARRRRARPAIRRAPPGLPKLAAFECDRASLGVPGHGARLAIRVACVLLARRHRGPSSPELGAQRQREAQR